MDSSNQHSPRVDEDLENRTDTTTGDEALEARVDGSRRDLDLIEGEIGADPADRSFGQEPAPADTVDGRVNRRSD